MGVWRLGAERSIDPSGTGILVQRDQWSVTREQQLDERWHLEASAYWVVNKDLQAISAYQDRRYRSADIGLSRILNRTWRVEARYLYAWQRYAGQNVQAESNTVILGINYSGL